MPRDPSNKLRTPSFRARLSTMKGLAPEEKALFQRIGNLVDVLSYSQRQASNPISSKRVLDERIPVPANVQVIGVPGGFTASWEAVDFNVRGDGLNFYEVQFSETITFAEFESLDSVSTRAVIKKRPAGGVLYVRVRTVSKQGRVSDFSSSAEISTEADIFLADQDAIDPENRTTVLPKPTLLGSALTNVDGDSTIFSGFGANVGPSPFTLDEISYANTDIRHDITYALHDAADPFPGIENLRLDTIGQEFLEEDPFYVYEPNFYIRPQVLTGSVTDFFTAISVALNPTQTNIEFLRSRILGDFYFPLHPQSGIVYNASMSTLKF